MELAPGNFRNPPSGRPNVQPAGSGFEEADGLKACDAPDVRSAPGAAEAMVNACEQVDAETEALIGRLRRAFEYDAAALACPRTCWLADSGSSAALAGAAGAAPLPPGTRLGDFEVLSELGRGGMGIVYRARQFSLDREVALKLLPAYARYGRLAVQRFLTEARAASRLHHSNIVPVYAQGEYEGQYYYAMELIEGTSLDRLVRDDKLRADWRSLAHMMAEVAEAVDYAHSQGVIHRDIKPPNLLLGRNGRLYLTDFGLARLAEEPHATGTGELLGTPAYLSPEQIRGNPAQVGPLTDVYSLGVTLYELITGQKPYCGQTREQIVLQICGTEPTAPRRILRSIPVELETIALRAMEKDPLRRYASAGLLAEDLRRFAEGRRIIARRAGRLTKAVRWARRHRTLSAVGVCLVLIFLLAFGWVGSERLARQREGRRVVRQAYDQLVYDDYYEGERVAPELTRAAKLGNQEPELYLARALVHLGRQDPEGALDPLETCLRIAPDDARGRYMLAWAYAAQGNSEQAQSTFAAAEAQHSPLTADAYFLRGRAIHYWDSATAIESYQEATALRAAEHAFFPQAVLLLARARNQRLYATRSLETFSDAVAALQQLVEHHCYKGYPQYLLSIAHRLAAEIYSGSSGTRDDSLVAEHYAQALEWARRGQAIEPDSDRPITAEAECLESMGRLAEAEQARTRAIAVARNDFSRCEGYHYRWRLRYWLGDYAGALRDLASCSSLRPQSPFYAYVYPALVQAEMGDLAGALERVRTLADASPPSAWHVLWAGTCLRLLGQGQAADDLLRQRAGTGLDFSDDLTPPQTEEWMRALYSYCSGADVSDALDDLVGQTSAPWRLWGELHFHAAALRLAQGDRAAALNELRRAYRSFDSETRYTYHAKVICVRMDADPAWPSWLRFPSDQTAGQAGEATSAAGVVPADSEKDHD